MSFDDVVDHTPYRENPEARTEANRNANRARLFLAAVGGVLVAMLGPSICVLQTVATLIDRGKEGFLTSITLGLSVAALGLGAGLPLAFSAINGLRGIPSKPLRLRHFAVGTLVVFPVVVFLGYLAVGSIPALRAVFPVLHVLSVILPVLAILSLVLGNTGTLTGRRVIGYLSFGMFVSIGISLVVEVIILVFLGMATVVVALVVSGDPARLMELLRQASENPAVLESNPKVMLTLVALVIFPLLMIIAPLVEELFKGIGMPVLGWGGSVNPLEGWLLGLVVGLGFALTEGLFNSLIIIEQWPLIVSMRVGTTLMHGAATGLMGLGFGYARTERRYSRLLLGFGAAALIHVTWNAITLLMSVSYSIGPMYPAFAPYLNLLGSLAAFGLVLMMAVTIAGMVAITHGLRNRYAAETAQ